MLQSSHNMFTVLDNPDGGGAEPSGASGDHAEAAPSPAGHDEPAGIGQPAPAPYRFQPGDGQVAGGLIEAAVVALTRLTDGWAAVKRAALAAGMPTDHALVEEAALIMGYHLRMSLGSEDPACHLAPMTAAGEHSWPRPIDSASTDVVDLWVNAAEYVSHPWAVARLQDLLFERKEGNRWVRARAAVTAYLDFAAGAPSELEKTEVLIRAWDLSRRVGDVDLHSRCQHQMAERARALMGTGCTLAGLLLPLLRALARGPLPEKGVLPVTETIDIESLLQEALGLFEDGYQVSHVAEIIRGRRPDAETVDAVNRKEVEAYLAQSESGPQLLRQTRLVEAIDIARRRGLHDMADKATAALQRIDPESLGMQRFSSSVPLPPGPVEEWLLGFVRSSDWRDGIRYLLATDPPTGLLSTLRDIEKRVRPASVPARLGGVQVLSSGGLPSFRPVSDEER
jgi:hypothetical protein